MTQALRSGRLLEALRLVDPVVLLGQLGLASAKLRSLREAHPELTSRLTVRTARPRGTD